MLWIEGRLGWIEQMCIRSYLMHGYEVLLYHYGPLENVPQGVRLLDAREILSDDEIVVHAFSRSPAPHADRFRYNLLLKRPDVIWSDTDAFCIRPYEPRDGYFIAWGTKGFIFIGVMKLPPHSAALRELVAFTDDPYPIPPWEKEGYNAYLRFRRRIGWPVHVSYQRWSVWGPRALTYFMKKHGEDKHVLPEKSLYPVSSERKEDLINGKVLLEDILEDEEIYSVHIYANWLRQVQHASGRGFPRQSLICQLAEHVGIEIRPEDYAHLRPLRPGPWLRLRKKLKI